MRTRTMRPRWVQPGQLFAMAAATALTACTGAPASPPVQSAATQVASPAATIAAAASPVASPAAAAAAAAASPAATAVAAAASPAATAAAAAASPIATALASSPVRITGGQLSPTDTTIRVENAGTAAVDMSGWRLRVGTATATMPANTRVAPGQTITIHTASGTSGGQDVYLGAEAAALLSGLQPGASVQLVDAQGTVVSEFAVPRL